MWNNDMECFSGETPRLAKKERVINRDDLIFLALCRVPPRTQVGRRHDIIMTTQVRGNEAGYGGIENGTYHLSDDPREGDPSNGTLPNNVQ